MPEYNNVEYNNKNRPWTIYASKICSDNSIYSTSYQDLSGLILEASNHNIDIKTNNGITKFHNDVSFIGDVSFNILSGNNLYSNIINVTDKIFLRNQTAGDSYNIDGNINLNGDIKLNGSIVNDITDTETTTSSSTKFRFSTILNSNIGIDSSGNYLDTLNRPYAEKAAFTDVSLNNLEVSNNIISHNLLLKNKENNLISIGSDYTVYFRVIDNSGNYQYKNSGDINNINYIDFSNKSFLLKLGKTYTFNFEHMQQNNLIELSYNAIFNNYIEGTNIINNNNTKDPTILFKVIRNFQNMDLKIIIKEKDNNNNNIQIGDPITFNNFFVFEYNINTIEKFTDIDNSINNLLINTNNSNTGSITNNSINTNLITSNDIINTNLITSKSLDISNSIKIEENTGKMKLIFY